MPEEIRIPDQTPQLSFTDKFIGILSSPGEVFQSVVSTEPKASNWVIPFILAIAFSVVFTFVVFTQPAIQDEMSAAQTKQFEQQIAAGKMTQEQVDQAMEFTPKPGSTMFLLFGSLAVVFVLAFALFVYTLVYWLIGKVAFKSTIPYGKVLEINGLTWYIMPISTLITMVMVVAMGSLYAQPGGALLISDFDPENKVHKLLLALNVLEFWMLYVTGVGLSKVWNVSLGKALGAVGGVFIVWTLIKVFAGLGFGM